MVEGTLPELAEEDRLTHAAEPDDNQRLLGTASGKAPEEDLERLEFLLAPDQYRRLGARIRRVRVVSAIHWSGSQPVGEVIRIVEVYVWLIILLKP